MKENLKKLTPKLIRFREVRDKLVLDLHKTGMSKFDAMEIYNKLHSRKDGKALINRATKKYVFSDFVEFFKTNTW
jgi:hypothetical protein